VQANNDSGRLHPTGEAITHFALRAVHPLIVFRFILCAWTFILGITGVNSPARAVK
jgi:hypothetical protein